MVGSYCSGRLLSTKGFYASRSAALCNFVLDSVNVSQDVCLRRGIDAVVWTTTSSSHGLDSDSYPGESRIDTSSVRQSHPPKGSQSLKPQIRLHQGSRLSGCRSASEEWPTLHVPSKMSKEAWGPPAMGVIGPHCWKCNHRPGPARSTLWNLDS